MTYYPTSEVHGLADIETVKRWAKQQEKQRITPKRIVGAFGIGTGRNEIIINWVVNHRKDPRHGLVGTPGEFSHHSKVSLDAMFKGWK